MTQIDKETCYKELSSLMRKQNCFDDMFVYSYTEFLEVDIYDYNSYFKMYNLLPSIGHSSQHLNYEYFRKENRWLITADWEDEQSVLQLVEVVTLIVETCMKAQSEFEKCFQEVIDIMK